MKVKFRTDDDFTLKLKRYDNQLIIESSDDSLLNSSLNIITNTLFKLSDVYFNIDGFYNTQKRSENGWDIYHIKPLQKRGRKKEGDVKVPIEVTVNIPFDDMGNGVDVSEFESIMTQIDDLKRRFTKLYRRNSVQEPKIKKITDVVDESVDEFIIDVCDTIYDEMDDSVVANDTTPETRTIVGEINNDDESNNLENSSVDIIGERDNNHQLIIDTSDNVPVKKRGRGRPKGSKNKPKDGSVEISITDTISEDGSPIKKRGRGRPKGSKNKPKDGNAIISVQNSNHFDMSSSEIESVVDDTTTKRGRGRPKGSKNKIKHTIIIDGDNSDNEVDKANIKPTDKSLEMIGVDDNESQPEGDTSFNFDDRIKVFEEMTGLDFTNFYSKYMPKLINHNKKFCKGNIQAAEDMAIESLMKALGKMDDTKGGYDKTKAHFSTWLFTISRNDSIQDTNKNNKNVSIDENVNDDEKTTVKDFISNSEDESFREYQEKELNTMKGQILRDKINDLEEPFRNVIFLREINNMSYREITIELRNTKRMSLNETIFNNCNYHNNTLELVDPENKKDGQIVKIFKINSIKDSNGDDVNYNILEQDKDGLISKIEIDKGEYTIDCEVPFNMSTLKSQIRNGREKLRNLVGDEFEIIDDDFEE